MTLKGKRGLFFVGQPHHMRLWRPVLEKLKKEGMDIIYITSHVYFPFEISASDNEIVPLYVEDIIKEEDLGLEEKIYEYVSLKLADIHSNQKVFNLFSPTVISKTLRFISREVILFKKFIDENKIDIIFALHELNRWSKLLAFLSFKKGIPFVTLQEGAYYIEHFSLSFHTEYSTANLVWGQQTVDLLRKLGNAPEKNIIVGDTHLDKALPKYKGKEKLYKENVCRDLHLDPNKPLIYLIQGSSPKTLDFPIGLTLSLMQIPDNFNFVLKMHPNATRNFVDNLREKYQKENFKIVQDYDSYNLLAASDLCVTLGLSTLTFEAFAFDKPVIELNYNEEELYFSKFGIAPAVKPENLIEAIETILKEGINTETKKNIEKWKEYVFYKLDCRSTDRVIETIKFILKEKEYYDKSKWKAPRIKLKAEKNKRISFNLLILGNVNLISETLNRLLELINPERDEINLIFPKPLKDFYVQFKENIEGRGIINFYLSEDTKPSFSSLYNFSLLNSEGEFIFLFKEGLVPLKIQLTENMLKEDKFFGAVIIDKNRKLKHLGVVFEHNNVAYRLYEDIEIEKVPIKSREYKAIDYVIGGKRELFEKVGRFDERIADYYSIIDYSLSAYYKGIKNLVSDKLFFGLIMDLSFQPLTPLSHIQFYTKWRGKTEYDLLKYTEEDGVDIYELYRK